MLGQLNLFHRAVGLASEASAVTITLGTLASLASAWRGSSATCSASMGYCQWLPHRRDYLRDRRVAGIAASRPWMIGIAALPGAIEYIHFVALLQEQRGPAAPAVGRSDPIRTLSVPAVNQDYWIRMANFARDPVLDIHLHAIAHCSSSQGRVLHAEPGVTPVGDIERRTWTACGRRLPWSFPGSGSDCAHPARAGNPCGELFELFWAIDVATEQNLCFGFPGNLASKRGVKSPDGERGDGCKSQRCVGEVPSRCVQRHRDV
jgi:hypothetical protein